MSNSSEDLQKVIVHYQECLEKYARRQDDGKMLYCIAKLWQLPVTVEHLTETGVGRTVNSLRKAGGDVGDSAKSLVGKWKDMVAKSEDVEDQQMDVQPSMVTETANNQIEEDDDDDEAYYIDEARTDENSEYQHYKQPSIYDNPVESYLPVSNKDVSKEHSSKEKVHDIDNNSTNNKTYKDTHKNKECDIEKRRDTKKDKHRNTDKHSDKKDSSTVDKYKHSSSKRKHENDNDGEKHASKSKKSSKCETDSDDTKNKATKRKNEEDDLEKSSKLKNSNSKNNKTESYSDSDDKNKSVKHRDSGDKHKSVKHKLPEETNEKTSKHKQVSSVNHNHDTDSDDEKHKVAKQKHHKDNKEKTSKPFPSESSRKNGYDSDEHKHKSVKHKHEESKEKVSKHNNHKVEIKSDERHHKSHKKKHNSDSDDEECVQDESSEEIEVKKPSSKSHHKEDKHRNRSKEKSDHSHRSKSSKDSKNKHSSKNHRRDDSKSKHSSKHNTSNSSLSSSASSKDQGSRKHSSHTTKNTTPSITLDEIGSGSGTSFAEALGMLAPSSRKGSKKKSVVPPSPVANESSGHSSPEQPALELSLLTNTKLEPLNINISSLLPEITPNYKPMGFPLDGGASRNKVATDDETLSAIMYNKISRTKVYSGNKIVWGCVPSLFDLCTRVLQDNIDALEYTGGVPFSILKPVLERANYNQLFMLEQYNPYLMEDTDELWKLHCQRDFRNKPREELETWRDMYQRCADEREVKLRALTANIKLSQDKSLPVRQTKLAYVDSVVKPPRNIARKQAKHGTAGVPPPPSKKPATSSSKLAALATAGAAGEIAVPNPAPRAAASSSSGAPNIVVKPKKAPLMQKTLALMKNRFRR